MKRLLPLQNAARNWFESLQTNLCRAFEQIETEALEEVRAEVQPAKFKSTKWQRSETDDQGGGDMRMLFGQVFEKAGIHTSTVYGEFSETFRAQIPGAEQDPRFWASGISLIAHPRNPHVPAAHMNTRMIVTTKGWFGGGADLNPMLAQARDRSHPTSQKFHKSLAECCARHEPNYYRRFSDWCDEYFYLPHRDEHRGVGGIFFDRLNTGFEATDLAFVKDVGETFLNAYSRIVRDNLHKPWTADEEKEQLFWRGRYAEFNLLYDRGTTFGLKTGGNVSAILSSLPPRASWGE